MTVLINYNLGIPDGPNNPSNDQPNMLENNDNIDQFVAVDHVPFNVNNSGFHTIIHQVPIGPVGTPDPTAIVGFGELYTKLVTDASTTDTQLFYRTGLGGISRLTGDSASQNGYQWLGGTLIQWGRLTQTFPSGGSSGTINFPINFPIACFMVTGTFFTDIGFSNPANTLTSNQTTLSQNSFDWLVNIGTPAFPGIDTIQGFFWFAIGA